MKWKKLVARSDLLDNGKQMARICPLLWEELSIISAQDLPRSKGDGKAVHGKEGFGPRK